MSSQLLNETFTTLRVGITTVHKTVDEGILDTVFLGNIAEFEQMVKELCTPPLLVSPIKWIFLPFSFAYEKAEQFPVLQNAAIGTSTVIFTNPGNDTSGTDIEVTSSELPICPSGKPTFSPLA